MTLVAAVGQDGFDMPVVVYLIWQTGGVRQWLRAGGQEQKEGKPKKPSVQNDEISRSIDLLSYNLQQKDNSPVRCTSTCGGGW